MKRINELNRRQFLALGSALLSGFVPPAAVAAPMNPGSIRTHMRSTSFQHSTIQ